MQKNAFLSLQDPGRFTLGCNYWASHAGTHMWREWRADVVARDLDAIAGAGMRVMRVFPLWPDFQPLTMLRGGCGAPVELRFGEAPLPDTVAGRAGLSEEMLGRFGVFCDLCEARGLSLIVGLITGWMSGRLYVPPAFAGLNVLSDPLVVKWQVRFVRHFVARFRDRAAVGAWDLGNECNCMAPCSSRDGAWVWAGTIANAIRVSDPSRPVVSGMHSLSARGQDVWSIQDQAELTDVLTTHPYPFFVPHCAQDPHNAVRTTLAATAESRLYADIGGVPCMAEEIGALGRMMCDEKTEADFARTNLFSLWAHDCRAFLWWCAFDQGHLAHAPYDWNAVERELGLMREDYAPKPVLAEIKAFAAFLESSGLNPLPPARPQGVCLLTDGQDSWGVAYSTFILARLAGCAIRFQKADQPLADAPLYLLPSVCRERPISRRRWLELIERVRDGATLYISLDDGVLAPLADVAGVDIITRAVRTGVSQACLTDAGSAPLRVSRGYAFRLAPRAGTTVLAAEEDGNPLITDAPFGKGRVICCTVPLEMQLTTTPGAFPSPTAEACRRLYRLVSESARAAAALDVDASSIGVTEHPLTADSRVVVLINYGPEAAGATARLGNGWRLDRVLRGAAPAAAAAASLSLCLPPNDAAVWRLARGSDSGPRPGL